MRFKVLYTNRQPNGVGGSFGASASFYTATQAKASALDWATQGASAYAYYWDGSSWTEYAPNP